MFFFFFLKQIFCIQLCINIVFCKGSEHGYAKKMELLIMYLLAALFTRVI